VEKSSQSICVVCVIFAKLPKVTQGSKIRPIRSPCCALECLRSRFFAIKKVFRQHCKIYLQRHE
jgi:hypothetical protein